VDVRLDFGRTTTNIPALLLLRYVCPVSGVMGREVLQNIPKRRAFWHFKHDRELLW
jgi:hypothetical protein